MSAERIVDIIDQFLLRKETDAEDAFLTVGRPQLVKSVQSFVEKNIPIHFILPAFPFKSPSSKKVLGTLPDFGEYYALFVLNSLCETMKAVYEHGASLTIVSDGSIYHDLVGVPTPTFQAYQEEIRRLGNEFPHLEFKSLKDLLTEPEGAAWIQDKQAFFEDKLVGFDLDAELASNSNLLQVYNGYLVFMESDLEQQLDEMKTSRSQKRKVVRSVARQLIRRGHVFSKLVDRAFPDSVRLSIHCHDNRGPKYAVAVAPSKCKTPWHNCVVLRQGKLEMMKVSQVNENAKIKTRNGHPWMLVEEDPDLVFPSGVEWDLLLPFGLLLKCTNVGLDQIPQDQLRRLTLKFGVVVLRGVNAIEHQDGFEKASSTFGRVQGWFFGNVLTLKFNPLVDINNVLSKEAMPMHYDGLFKLDENGNSMVPNFQYFYSKHGSGTTLFCDTRMIVDQFAPLRTKKWRVFTPKNNSFGGRPLEIDIVQTHPEQHTEHIRFHEPWGQDKTAFKPTHVEILADDAERWSQRLTDCLYNRRFCLHHTWSDQDVVVADNLSLMHTRLAFDDSNRELWRIHYD